MSAASGIVVTRSATGDQLGRALSTQFFAKTRVVNITAAIIGGLGLLPACRACRASSSRPRGFWRGRARRQGGRRAPPNCPRRAAAGRQEGLPQEEIDQTLAIHPAIEVGYELVSIVDGPRRALLDRVAKLRKEVARARHRGPAGQRHGRPSLPAGMCPRPRLRHRVASGECARAASSPSTRRAPSPPIEGRSTVDPTFGLPAFWIIERDRSSPKALGYTGGRPLHDSATLGEVVPRQCPAPPRPPGGPAPRRHPRVVEPKARRRRRSPTSSSSATWCASFATS